MSTLIPSSHSTYFEINFEKYGGGSYVALKDKEALTPYLNAESFLINCFPYAGLNTISWDKVNIFAIILSSAATL